MGKLLRWGGATGDGYTGGRNEMCYVYELITRNKKKRETRWYVVLSLVSCMRWLAKISPKSKNRKGVESTECNYCNQGAQGSGGLDDMNAKKKKKKNWQEKPHKI